jgi:hypothetical protein
MAKFQTEITLAIKQWPKSDKEFRKYGYFNNVQGSLLENIT